VVWRSITETGVLFFEESGELAVRA
jgi:hypothetical protein